MEVSQGILMKRVKINHPDAKEIFLNAIHDNQVIAYPTDTIYGLGTAMNNDEGIERINLMKMRKQPMSIALGSFSVIKNQIIVNENTMLEIEEVLKASETGKASMPQDYKWKWNETEIEIMLDDNQDNQDIVKEKSLKELENF